MDTQLKEAGPFERIITVEVPEAEIEKGKQKAARTLARDVKIPGFRPGKAPAKVVEATVGKERLRQEAIDEVLPEVVARALEEQGIEPAVAPTVEEIRDVESGIVVDLRITLWPEPESLPEYRGRHIEVTSPEVTEEEITEQLDRMREQFAELEVVDRPAQEGDFVTFNLSATQGGVPVEEASATDLSYPVGSGAFIPGLDEHLLGKGKGEIVEFEGPLPQGFGERAGETVTYRVLIKDVRQRKLPELTDEWISEMTEHETVESFVAELRERLAEVKADAVRREISGKALESLIEDLDIEIPEGLIQAEMEAAFHRFAHELERQGIELGQYLALTGQTQDAFVSDLRMQAERNVRVDILLDAVAKAEGIEVTEEEWRTFVEALAERTEGETTESLLEKLAGTSQEAALKGDMRRRRALEAIEAAVVPVDASGEPIVLPEPTIEAEAEGPDEDSGDTSADAADSGARDDAAVPEAASSGTDETEDDTDDAADTADTEENDAR